MTSSPCSKKATQTEYWPEGGGSVGLGRVVGCQISARLTFVGAASDENFSVGVEVATEICLVMLLDGLTEAESALGVRIVVRSHRL